MLSNTSPTTSENGKVDSIPTIEVEAKPRMPKPLPQPVKKGKTMTAVEWFNVNYPVFLNLLINVSDVILTLCRTLLVTFGVPVALVFIMYVEQERLYQGIEIFEVNTSLSRLAAWVLVILNTVLEFLVVYVEDRDGHIEEPSFKNSLRLIGRRVWYLIGFAALQHKSPANRYKGILSLVTFAILFLALLGSMHDEMLNATGAWHQAIWSLLTESSLIDFTTWISSLLFAFTLVMSAQSLSNYVALHTTMVIKSMSSKRDAIKTQKQLEEEERLRDEQRTKADQLKRNGQPTSDIRVRIMADGTHTAKCPDCGWVKAGYVSLDSAKAGLNSHKPYCKPKVQVSATQQQ